MSLMSALYRGVSGIQTSQNALNTTAHNLANTDTTGYTRQQVSQGDMTYLKFDEGATSPKQTGLGVDIMQVRAVRDYFLDLQYRSSNGKSSYYSTNSEVITEINTLFGELEGEEFQTSLQELKNAFIELAKNSTDATNENTVITKAQEFLTRAQDIYNGISDYQDNLNEQIVDQVEAINEYAQQIHDLNIQIATAEAGGIETANDLRDKRDLILDELSSYGKVEYTEDAFKYVTVLFEGETLVNHGFVNEMEAVIEDDDVSTGFYTVRWKSYDMDVYDGTAGNAKQGTDKGSLRALIEARGTKRGTFADLDAYSYEDDDGVTQSGTASENFENVDSSSLASVQALLDNLVNGIVTKINTLLNHTEDDDVTVSQYDENGDALDTGTYLSSAGVYYYDLFLPIDSSETDYHGQDITYTCSNLKINKILLEQPTKINNGFVSEKNMADTDQDTADALAAIFTDEYETLTPDTLTPLTFSDYYIGIVNAYSDLGAIYKNMSESADVELDNVEAARQSVAGVSDSEELTKMIRYQNAYNASSRYFNVVNDMLENLLTQLA
ncbi:MAG: flagellar hook-associated protein FlgK [Lachnospiraceae bacterium]|nr:flagellar hook-associated protein FlgK [Lachnospiraceae bacterium]